ncbi:uncharacterized protein BBA_10254 [Beauveria bassiana ARSEF 2860]|uniref:Uncharacterized protein n=1 Tax=Beauveria bassiana (strain ARSEF 2860) TaxID=655819 RepID=J5J9P2_BEAB2|nr:uncharacterized protein BBA_10254 [Beauveria bassiana ARSEF 2860]EJP60796.1 hypothetical protein BBA_10254 [Beauveria bassiana ARSEF 2860]
MSGPVCDITPGLSTPQVDASFPKISQQTYQLYMQNVDDSSDSQQHAMNQRSHSVRPASSVVEHSEPGATAMSTNVQSRTVELALFNHGLVTPGQSPDPIDVSSYIPPAPWDTRSFRSYCQNNITKAPQLLLPQFGHDVFMDNMGRKLFSFYIHNWCPGRSVLTKTNLWLTDFASMKHPAVVAAIQSLAGVYVHDYLPCDNVRRQVNKRFAIAEARLSELLQDAAILDESESGELVTLASLLSMQDVVLIERRLQKPYWPRWLTGFTQAENVLQRTDPGSRFYKDSNVQVSALRLSQSVIVGRGVILAQLMMPLPSLATFDPIVETCRFGFLLYGSESDMYEIHGGCGFSKRLLHIFSQVTYCSTRMLQECETPIVPVTAQMLYDQLVQLPQWSGEYDSWDAAKNRSQPIEWIRQVGENYVVQEAKQMTGVTAEAWRLAGMVYLQCRLFRLPRNHQLVVDNIADLAKCISIMPTSGFIFTAQAPLLPVFFLGLLATVEEHVLVADAWFQHVIETPVRSSVPPLYQALRRIQSWMDHEVPVPAPNTELPCAIAMRQPWWELMVSKVQEKENEVLCLT